MTRLLVLIVALLSAITSAAQDGGKTWATAVASRPSDDRKVVYRFIQEFLPSFDRSRYPVRITLSWWYESPSGMPSVSVRESMDKFEDLLGPQLEDSSLASLALVRTGDNLRQWTYYTKSESAFRAKLDVALRGSPSPIDVNSELEPGWETYEQFVRALRK